MIKKTITIDGNKINYEVHPHPTGTKVLVEAPGVVSFDAESNEVEAILISLYSQDADA